MRIANPLMQDMDLEPTPTDSELADRAWTKEKNRREAERVEAEIRGEGVSKLEGMVWLGYGGRVGCLFGQFRPNVGVGTRADSPL